MEQAQHFDSKFYNQNQLQCKSSLTSLFSSVASLLSCLHQLKLENSRLEDTINGLVSRRDHLLAVNARLAIPLGQQTATSQGMSLHVLQL